MPLENQKKKQSSFLLLMKVLWSNDRKMHIRLICSFILVVISSVLIISLPWIMKTIIDSLSDKNNSSMLVWILISYGIIWIVSQIVAVLREFIAYRAFERAINKFGLSIFESLLKISIKYHNRFSTGGVMNHIERAQHAIPDIFAGLFFTMIPMTIEIIVSVSILTYAYDICYSSVLFLTAAAYILYTYLTINWLITAQKKENILCSRVSSYLADILLNIECIHYQCSQEIVTKECAKRLSDREDGMTEVLEKSSIVNMGQNLIAGGGLIITTILLGFGVMNKKLVLSDFVLFNGYLLQFLVPMSMLGMMFRNFRDGLTKMEDATDILSFSPENTSSTQNIIIPKKSYNIQFENVNFTYPDEKTIILKDVSFQISAGKTLAILGENGSGKTTITKLLYRFYESYGGKILVGGHEIRDINLYSLRKIIGVIPQDIFILNTSIYENLLFGNKNICKEKFDTIIKVTNIDEMVSTFPNSYETIVGERGITLSGGQKQRIGIARALLHEADILILDEATSSLDCQTEAQVFNYLNSLQDVTKIIITHDQRNLKNMDGVIYLSDGIVDVLKKS